MKTKIIRKRPCAAMSIAMRFAGGRIPCVKWAIKRSKFGLCLRHQEMLEQGREVVFKPKVVEVPA